jgi:hypothetical protein
MPEDYHETAAEEKLTAPPPPPAKPKEKSLGDQIWSDILGFGKRAGSYAKDRSKKATRKAYERGRAKASYHAKRTAGKVDAELRRRKLLEE